MEEECQAEQQTSGITLVQQVDNLRPAGAGGCAPSARSRPNCDVKRMMETYSTGSARLLEPGGLQGVLVRSQRRKEG